MPVVPDVQPHPHIIGEQLHVGIIDPNRVCLQLDGQLTIDALCLHHTTTAVITGRIGQRALVQLPLVEELIDSLIIKEGEVRAHIMQQRQSVFSPPENVFIVVVDVIDYHFIFVGILGDVIQHSRCTSTATFGGRVKPSSILWSRVRTCWLGLLLVSGSWLVVLVYVGSTMLDTKVTVIDHNLHNPTYDR